MSEAKPSSEVKNPEGAKGKKSDNKADKKAEHSGAEPPKKKNDEGGEKPDVKKPARKIPSPQSWTPAQPRRTQDVDNDGFTLVEGRKKKKKTETVIPSLYPVHRRALLANFSGAVKDWKAQATADKALATVNSVMRQCPDVPSAPFLRARFSSSQSLVLTTGHEMSGDDYEAYLGVIGDSLKNFRRATVKVCEPWTRFVLHNIPVGLKPQDIKTAVEDHYPSLKMCQTPFWLLPKWKIADKTSSSVVISLVGNLSVEKIGTDTLWLHNRRCMITPHFGYGRQTQCLRCLRFGHHTQLCHAKEPTCAVCARNHFTKSHSCPIPNCKQGQLCVHPPIQCINCKAPHKATDKACPARAKALLAARLQNKKSFKKEKLKSKWAKAAENDESESPGKKSPETEETDIPAADDAPQGEPEGCPTPNVAAVQEPLGEQPMIIDPHSSVDEGEL